MPDPTEGLQPTAELPVTGTQPQQELPTVTTPAAVAPANNQPTADYAAQLAAANARAEQAEHQARHFQSETSQVRRQVQALTNQQPPADPLAGFVEQAMRLGITDDPKQARALIELNQLMMAPLAQSAQQAQAIAQSGYAVDNAMQQAYATMPQALQNPAVQQLVMQQLREDAQRGVPVNGDYALGLAKMAAWDAMYGSNGQQATPPPQQQTPNFRSQVGPVSQFQPAPAQNVTKTLTDQQQKWNNDFKTMFPGPQPQ